MRPTLPRTPTRGTAISTTPRVPPPSTPPVHKSDGVSGVKVTAFASVFALGVSAGGGNNDTPSFCHPSLSPAPSFVVFPLLVLSLPVVPGFPTSVRQLCLHPGAPPFSSSLLSALDFDIHLPSASPPLSSVLPLPPLLLIFSLIGTRRRNPDDGYLLSEPKQSFTSGPSSRPLSPPFPFFAPVILSIVLQSLIPPAPSVLSAFLLLSILFVLLLLPFGLPPFAFLLPLPP